MRETLSRVPIVQQYPALYEPYSNRGEEEGELPNQNKVDEPNILIDDPVSTMAWVRNGNISASAELTTKRFRVASLAFGRAADS